MRVVDANRRNLLEGKVALITGGAGSLATATARLFLKEGARVFLADRDEKALGTAGTTLDDVRVETLTVDVGSEDDVATAVDRVVDRAGRLDVVVALAGVPASVAPVTEFDVAEFDRAYRVYVRGVFVTCKHALRVLGDGGAIVIVSGVAGLRSAPGLTAYAAAEHAQVGLMRALAREAAPRAIRVNTVHPGPVDNRFQDGVEEQLGPVLGRNATRFLDRQIPLGRHARPEEIAQAITYLASRQSSFVTGSTLVVDGGMSI